MSSLMRLWQDFCLLVLLFSQWSVVTEGEDPVTQRETHIYSTTNFSHSHLVNILHISSSHDVKSESITEYDIYYNCSGRHIVLLSHAMQTFPSLLTLLLCSVVADLIICFQSFAFYDFSPSLSLFCPPPPFPPHGCVTVPLSVVLTGLVVTKHLPGIWCTAWVFAATNHVPAGLTINEAQSNPWRTHLIFAVCLFVCLMLNSNGN